MKEFLSDLVLLLEVGLAEGDFPSEGDRDRVGDKLCLPVPPPLDPLTTPLFFTTALFATSTALEFFLMMGLGLGFVRGLGATLDLGDKS